MSLPARRTIQVDRHRPQLTRLALSSLLSTLCLSGIAGAQKLELLRDINVNGGADPGSSMSRVATLGTRSVFFAWSVPFGIEPWVTDGTSPGTKLLKDVWPGKNHCYPGKIASNGKLAVFFADDGTHGFEPWVTDGTPLGTRLLVDMNPGSPSTKSGGVASAAGRLFLTTESGL